MKQGVINVKPNKSNFDEKSSYDARIVFLVLIAMGLLQCFYCQSCLLEN